MSIWNRSPQMPSKHAAYFEVLGALRRSEADARGFRWSRQSAIRSQNTESNCPICHLSQRNLSRYLDTLSYENVNDPGVRASLRASRGFCNHHAWQFAEEIRDGLGTAIIYRDIVKTLLDTLKGADSVIGWHILPRYGHSKPDGNDDPLSDRLAPGSECLACESLIDSSNLYLDTLLAHLPDRDLSECYLSSSGLCVPHLATAISRSFNDRDIDLLVEPLRRRFAERGAEPPLGGLALTMEMVEAIVGAIGSSDMNGSQGNLLADAHQSSDGTLGTGQETLVQEEACPVCEVVVPALDAWLLALPDELTRRPELSEQAQWSLGICSLHAWHSAKLAPASLQQVITLAVDQIRHGLNTPTSLKEAREGYWWLGLAGRRPQAEGVAQSLVSHLRPSAPCPACERRAVLEKAAVEEHLTKVQRDRASATNGEGTGLCMGHFLLALRLAPDAQTRASLMTQLQSLEDLHTDLDRYVYKHDYRFREQPWGKEKNAPWRAIAAIAGGRQMLVLGSIAGTKLNTLPT